MSIKQLTRCVLLVTLLNRQAYTQTKPKIMDSNILQELKHQREFFDNLGRIYPAAEQVSITPENIEGISCYRFTPPGKNGDKIILYLHGGAFGMGSIQSHGAMVSHLADSLHTTLHFVEYALAPEHPFPAALNNVLAVYKHLLKQHSAANVIIIGDSAGGGLLLSALGSLQDAGLDFPGGIIMLSPWLNLDCTNASYTSNKTSDLVLTHAELEKFASYYAPGNRTAASPHRIKLKSLPPLLVMVGSGEILLDDSKDFYGKAKQLQKQVIFHIYPGQAHVWPLTDVHSAASKKAVAEMAEFISSLH